MRHAGVVNPINDTLERIMNQSVLPLFLAAMLAAVPACADGGFDFIGGAAQAEKPAKSQTEKPVKAPREVNQFSTGSPMTQAAAAGAGLVFLGPIGAIGVPIATIAIAKNEQTNLGKINAFYSGAVTRGRVTKIYSKVDFSGWSKPWGMDPNSAPVSAEILNEYAVLQADVDGPTGSDRIAIVRKDVGHEVGDIVDVKLLVGTYAFNPQIDKKTKLDFNKHMPRVVGVYCKHDNPVCQNDYDSSLGVLYRHTDTEFPPSQYLIDPAIIAADQAKMRKEAEEKKAAQNSGGFNFM
jgi:hypothetical protein